MKQFGMKAPIKYSNILPIKILFKFALKKAKDFLDQILFAIKDNVIKSEVNGKWVCAEEIPSKIKEALKMIQKRIFKIKIRKDENYSDNIKQFLMILSVAVRICAMIGQNNELQAFLTAYKCSSKDQSQTPPIMYSFGILPKYSNAYIGNLGHPSGEIVAISLNKNISTESKQNFNFLLKLSEIELSPFDMLNLAKKIRSSLKTRRTDINIEHPAIYDLVIAHFYRFSGSYSQVDFKVFDYCNLTNFVLQMMNRVQESPNLSEYFAPAEFSKELGQQFKAEFTTEFKQKLGEFYNLENEYRKYCDHHDVVREINKHQDFLHFAEAIHVNWNPYKELLNTLHKFKYIHFCSKEGLEYLKKIIDQKLLKECQETEKDRELMKIIQSNYFSPNVRFKLDELMPKLQTLENFEQIQRAYEKLKEFEKLFVKGKCTENEEKNAFKSIMTLNDELEKAKTFCMEKI